MQTLEDFLHRMLQDLRLRGMSESAQESYVYMVFAKSETITAKSQISLPEMNCENTLCQKREKVRPLRQHVGHVRAQVFPHLHRETTVANLNPGGRSARS